MLWQARANVIALHGAAAGNQRMLQLVTDGMKLNPVNPTFVQARDSILAADCTGFAGEDEIALWQGFAARGLGFQASVLDDSPARVVDSFVAPLWTAVAGRLTAATLSCAWRAGADVAGVRGAACDGGRSGLVSRDRVRALRALLAAAGTSPAAAAPRPADRPAPRPPTGAGAGHARSPDPRDPLRPLPAA
jgi:hypothetical protein